VKYRGLLNEVKKLRAQLAPSAGITIRISGGLPEGFDPQKQPEPAPPPGSDLHAQHRAFAGTARQGSAPERPRQAPQKPAGAFRRQSPPAGLPVTVPVLPPPVDAPIDLREFHYRVHGVTGDMAIAWCRATPADLVRWADTLRVIADGMAAAAAVPVCQDAPLRSIEARPCV
jgi:hypothetical protein